MSLLRTAGHMAVASSVHGRVQQRQRRRWAADAPSVPEPAVAPAAPAPPVAPVAAAPAPAASVAIDPAQRIALLTQLAELHRAGVLSDEEFGAQKAQLLA